MYDFLKKVDEVRNGLSISAFARSLGMGQKTVDFYLRGERKPSVEFVWNICSKFNVSADWLLGLPERGGSSTSVIGNTGIIGAVGAGARATVRVKTAAPPPADCANCKYKRLADAFKAL